MNKRKTKKYRAKPKRSTTTTLKRELLPQRIIQDILWNAKSIKREMWPVRSNRASELGHPCERRLVYLRITPPKKRVLHNTSLQFIFDLGKQMEIVAKDDLREAGFKLYDVPKGEVWDKYNISGKIDTRIEWKKKIVIVEIKGINHFLWMKLAKDPHLDTLLNDDRAWVKKIPGQLLIYLLLHNQNEGFLFLKDKLTNQPLIIWAYLQEPHHLEIAEGMLKKAESINKHVANDTLPDRIKNRNMCMQCEFKTMCLPDITKGEALELLQEDTDIIDRLERREEIKPLQSEYNKLDKQVKKIFDDIGKKKVAIGDFIIERITKHREQKTTVKEAYDYITTKITKLGKK